MFPTPVSAVPVLPATGIPEVCADVPVPPVTTACIIELSWAATCGRITRASLCGFVSTIVFPPGAITRCTRYGRISRPWFATVEATIAICSGVTCSRSCQNASRPGRTGVAGFLGTERRPSNDRTRADSYEAGRQRRERLEHSTRTAQQEIRKQTDG